MNSLYQQTLNGTVASLNTGSGITISVKNDLPITVNLVWLSYQGQQVFYAAVPPGTAQSFATYVGNYWMATVRATGSLATVFQVVAGTTNYSISLTQLTAPNNLGSYPVPNSATIIPPDSPRVLVGCGKLPKGPSGTGSAVIREQYWERLGDSYCLAAGETRVFSTTTKSGKQETSSTQKDVAASLGLSTSAGWGPASASISSSLSASASSFQQVTVSEETTAYVSDTLTNKSTTNSVMYLRWQLTDVITVFNSSGLALSSVILAEDPVLIDGPYDPKALPPPTIFAPVSNPMIPSLSS